MTEEIENQIWEHLSVLENHIHAKGGSDSFACDDEARDYVADVNKFIDFLKANAVWSKE